jgi:hypothetical protein
MVGIYVCKRIALASRSGELNTFALCHSLLADPEVIRKSKLARALDAVDDEEYGEDMKFDRILEKMFPPKHAA